MQQGMMALGTAITAVNGGTIDQILSGLVIGAIASGVPGGGGFWESGVTGQIARSFGDSMQSSLGAAMFMGGAVAKAQGGKFIDGVKGAAIGFGVSYGVGRIVHAIEKKAEALRDSKHSGGYPDRSGAEAAVSELHKQGVLASDLTFEMRDDAAKYFADYLYGISAKYKIELGAELIHNGKSWSIGKIKYGGARFYRASHRSYRKICNSYPCFWS